MTSPVACPRPALGRPRWTWPVIAAYTQPRLGRDLTNDIRRAWERPVTQPCRLTPARVRRGFRRLRAKPPVLACVPNHTGLAQGCRSGSRDKHVAVHPPVGKTQHPN
jgi:hypothetical protein